MAHSEAYDRFMEEAKDEHFCYEDGVFSLTNDEKDLLLDGDFESLREGVLERTGAASVEHQGAYIEKTLSKLGLSESDFTDEEMQDIRGFVSENTELPSIDDLAKATGSLLLEAEMITNISVEKLEDFLESIDFEPDPSDMSKLDDSDIVTGVIFKADAATLYEWREANQWRDNCYPNMVCMRKPILELRSGEFIQSQRDVNLGDWYSFISLYDGANSDYAMRNLEDSSLTTA